MSVFNDHILASHNVYYTVILIMH